LQLRSHEWKELEIVVLRHELGILAAPPTPGHHRRRPDVPRGCQPDALRGGLNALTMIGVAETQSNDVGRKASRGRCPFLALSVQQREAKAGRRRHKAKVENRSLLGAMTPDPATSDIRQQSAAKVSFSAC
jgi:hypothetical protein